MLQYGFLLYFEAVYKYFCTVFSFDFRAFSKEVVYNYFKVNLKNVTFIQL